MDKYFFNTGTVTRASRGRDFLRMRGFNAYVQSAKGNLGTSGCGFGIVVATNSPQKVRSVLQDAGISVSNVTPFKNIP